MNIAHLENNHIYSNVASSEMQLIYQLLPKLNWPQNPSVSSTCSDHAVQGTKGCSLLGNCFSASNKNFY